MSNEAAMAAHALVTQMQQRHTELISAAEYKPGLEGVLLATEELVLEKWLHLYRQLITDNGQDNDPR